MKPPFKTPAKYEMKITNTDYVVIDAERKVIAKCNYEDDALFIQQIINSHKKLVGLLRDSTNIFTGLIQENDILDTDCPTTFSHNTLQKITRQRKANKQALSETEKA